MIIKSTAGVALAAVCLTAIATLSGAHAQMGGPPPGSYWAPPAPYELEAISIWLKTDGVASNASALRQVRSQPWLSEGLQTAGLPAM
jgi:hypothetical protein